MFTKEISDSRQYYLLLLILLLISFAVYANSLVNDFVYDDMMQVLKNPWIKDVKFLPDIFTRNVWGFHGGEQMSSNYYRPMMNVIFMVNYHIFGLNPWGFHLVNVLFHAANSLLVFFLVAKLFPPARSSLALPFVAALIFSVHPIHTEAVAWVCGITDISFTFFFLISFYLYILSDGADRKQHYILSLVFYFFSLLCKEPGVILPLILFTYDLAFRNTGESFSLRAKRLIPYIVVAGIYLIIRYSVLGGISPLNVNRSFDLYMVVLNTFPLFMQYIEKLLLPINLNVLHPLIPVVSLTDPKAIAGLTVAITFFVLFVIAFRKNKRVFFGLTVIAVPLFPVLNINLLGESALAERYLYLPSVGFAILLSMAGIHLKEKRREFGPMLLAVLVLLTGIYSVQTIKRNTAWKTNSTLYADMVKSSPNNESAAINLANALMAEGRFDQAIELCQSILANINPNSDRAYYILGLGFQEKGRAGDAAPAYERSLSLNPRSSFADGAHFNLARIYLDVNETQMAIEHLRVAVSLQPTNPFYHNMLGIAYGKKGFYDLAIAEFEVAVRLAPNEIPWRTNLDKARALKAGSMNSPRRK